MHVAIKALRMGAADYIEKDRNSFFQLKQIIDKVIFRTGFDPDVQQTMAS